ncbi:MAG: hypothetical protein COA43_11940 [Robiginitomaculum sp.]|nr:MAG: hypothetical protein COA43_11940 [Robiginitomaculum sp.]
MNGLQNTSTDTMFAPLTTNPQEGDVSMSEFQNNNSQGDNAFAGILESLGVDKPLPTVRNSLVQVDIPNIQSTISTMRENGFFTDTPTLHPHNDVTLPYAEPDLQTRQDALLAITNAIHENGFLAFDLPLDNDSANIASPTISETVALNIDISALLESIPFFSAMFNATNTPTGEVLSVETLSDEVLSDLVPITETATNTLQNPLHLAIESLLTTRDLLIANVPISEAFSSQRLVATNTSTAPQNTLQSTGTPNLPIEAILSQEDLLTLNAPIGELLSRPILVATDDTPQKTPSFKIPVSEPAELQKQNIDTTAPTTTEALLSKFNIETLSNPFSSLNTQNHQTIAPVSEANNTPPPTTQVSMLATELTAQNNGTQTNLGGENKQNQPIPTLSPLNNEVTIAPNTNMGTIEQIQQIFTAETSNSVLSTSTNAVKSVSFFPPSTLSHIAVQQVGNALLQTGIEKNSDIVIRLDPAELGRVNISFTFDKTNGVTANIIAETSSTAAILRERADVLVTQLKQSGFDNVNLNFDTRGDSQSDKGFGSQFSNQQQGQKTPQHQPRIFDINSQLIQETSQPNTMRAQKMYSATDAIDIKL